MKSASAVLKSREQKRQQRIKDNQNQINKELLEFEKALNMYEGNIEDDKPYITVDTIIKTDEVKSLLKQNGYYIDKVSNDIEVNTTRVYLDEISYRETMQKNYKKPLSYSEYGTRIRPFINTNSNKENNNINEKQTINIVGDKDSIDLLKLIEKISQLHECKSCY